MRARAEARDYAHTVEGKVRRARGYALVSSEGRPLFVGLFADEAKAEAYCKARGWTFLKAES